MTWRPGTHVSDRVTMRYRGSAKRGRQDTRTAVIDLDHAIEALQRARDVLEAVPAAAQDKRARERLLGEAREHAELAQRFVQGVVRGVLGGGRPRRKVRMVRVQLDLRLR